MKIEFREAKSIINKIYHKQNLSFYEVRNQPLSIFLRKTFKFGVFQ